MKYNSWEQEILSVCLLKLFKMSPFLVLLTVCCLPYVLGSNNVYRLNERDFEGYIRDKDVMLVDFFAPWCHHCQQLSPELDAAADQLAGKNQFVFAKVDCTNDGKQLCQRFNIQGYPTMKLFKYGQYVGDYVGQRDRGSLMQYMDSVASTINQHTPLTTGVINYRPQAPLLPSHHASSIHAPGSAIAPTYMHQATQAKDPSLMASFYGSAAHAQQPPHIAAYLGNAPPLQQASPDSLQSKFGNLASLDIYRSKLKMIAAYKNYQRRLKEYREKLILANRARGNPNPQGFPGAVTQPPRPGVNAFAQPQAFRGYYRPEAMAAQNVQINRANPLVGFGAYTTNYPNQFASPYGYQAVASSPYYRSKTGDNGKRHHGKNGRPAPRPASVRKTAYNRQPEGTQAINQAAYYKQQQFRQQQFRLQQQQQRQKQLQQQQFHEENQQQQRQKQLQQQQFHEENQQQQRQKQLQQQQFHEENQQQQRQKQLQQQQFHEENQQQQRQKQLQQQQFHEENLQQQYHQEPPNRQQQQAYNKPQAPQPVANPAPLSPPQSSNPLAATDTSALKDLKADIESAIQDALKNAVTKEGNKKKITPSVQVDGERAKPQATATHSDQSGSGSGAHSQSSPVRGSGIEDAVTGEGSGSGVKPDSP